MKTKNLILSTLLFAAMVCSLALISCVQGLTGNGTVVTKEISVNSFSELELNGVFNVFISQGNKESVKIETDANLQETVIVLQNANSVTIESKDKISVVKATKLNHSALEVQRFEKTKNEILTRVL